MGVPGTPANSTGPKIVLWQLSKEWIPGPEATVHVRGVGSRPSAGVGANPAVFPRQQLCSECSQLRLDKSQLGGGGEPSPTSYPQTATENVLKIRNILFTLLSMSNRQRSPSSQRRLYQPPVGARPIKRGVLTTLGIISLCVSCLRLVYFTFNNHFLSVHYVGGSVQWLGGTVQRGIIIIIKKKKEQLREV